MKNHGMVVAIIVFICIVVGMFVFAFLRKDELQKFPPSVEVRFADTKETQELVKINAKHFFKKDASDTGTGSVRGEHTIVGDITLNTACDLLTWDTGVTHSAPEAVVVFFKTVTDGTACAPATLPQRFKVNFVAEKDVRIDAKLDGADAEFNFIPVGDNESPDNFELFLKG